MQDLARRCAQLTDTVEQRKLARAKSEAHVETAKERLQEAMKEAREAGFGSMKEMESTKESLTSEIERMISEGEALVA